MIVDQHDVARREVRVEPARCIGDDKRGSAEPGQQIDGESNVARVPSLIEVKASLHDHTAPAEQRADDQPAFVARRGRDGKSLDFIIGDDGGARHGLGELAET